MPDAAQNKVAFVREMFAKISGSYDRLNNILSFGFDQHWRRVTARSCAPPPGSKVLDVAAGTARLSRDLARQYPESEVIGVDFSPEMLAWGQRRLEKENNCYDIRLVRGDATRLPFPERAFAAVTIGYALRNIPDLPGALREAMRVLRPGGRFIALELTRPRLRPLKPLYRFYIKVMIPFVGGIISGKRHAYDYLGESVKTFQEPEEFAALMMDAGFAEITVHRLTFGAATVWVGVKPS